ncbi:2OG-Fe(II) oxygenase [Pokkaliibacter sp. CJK22405]|uniref:2OG-Fe(II) oxygenase n=1 Tax=Pokkaliibacter sp. CJK22405 TaxID=3384615 RepID=UPI003984FF99
MTVTTSLSTLSPFDQVADDLCQNGFGIYEANEGLAAFLNEDLMQSLYDDLQQRYQDSDMYKARVGEQKQTRGDIRGDDICWLRGESEAQRHFLTLATDWRQAFSRRLFLALTEFEFHYARYPQGKGYARHYDNFQGKSPRRLTFILYLNPDWQPGDGGELVIYDANNQPITQVAPRWGTVVFFASDEFPHEVLPAVKPRCSLTGWFRSGSVFPLT